MTFKLIDEKNIPRLKFVYPIVNKKLFSSRDGKIDLIAVMDMDAHRFFIVIQLCDGKGSGVQTGPNR